MGTPALLAAQSAKVLSAANQSSKALYRRVVQGGLCDDATSTYSGWLATIKVNMTRAILSSTSGAYDVAALSAAVMTTTFGNGASATSGFASIVADNSSGTPAFNAYVTADAATAALSDAEMKRRAGRTTRSTLRPISRTRSRASAAGRTTSTSRPVSIVAGRSSSQKLTSEP